jgi:hypothetical protein
VQITTRVTGLEEVLGKLKQFQADAADKILNKGLRAGAKLILAEQKARAPISTDPRLVPGLLALALGIKSKTYKSAGVVVFIIGPQTRFTRNKRTKERKPAKWLSRKRVQKLFAKHPKASLAQRQTPTAYAHLAGPGRKEQWFTSSTQAIDRAQQAIIDAITEAIDKAGQ